MTLDLLILGIGIMYYLVGNFINKENAKILLAGYNTMSNSEREKFDIDGYLKLFKPFFKKLGIYSVFMYFLLSLIVDEETAIWIWFFIQIISLVILAFYGNSYKNR